MLRYYLSKNFLINHTYVTTKSMSNPHAINTMSKRNQTLSLNNGYVRIAYCPFTPLHSSIVTTRRPVPTLVKFKFISNNQFYIMVHFARRMKQTTIINSNDSRQSVCFYINYVYSTFLHMYTQYTCIYPSSHIHDTDRPNKRICKTTPYLKKYASFSNTQELHLLYLNHI